MPSKFHQKEWFTDNMEHRHVLTDPDQITNSYRLHSRWMFFFFFCWERVKLSHFATFDRSHRIPRLWIWRLELKWKKSSKNLFSLKNFLTTRNDIFTLVHPLSKWIVLHYYMASFATQQPCSATLLLNLLVALYHSERNQNSSCLSDKKGSIVALSIKLPRHSPVICPKLKGKTILKKSRILILDVRYTCSSLETMVISKLVSSSFRQRGGLGFGFVFVFNYRGTLWIPIAVYTTCYLNINFEDSC